MSKETPETIDREPVTVQVVLKTPRYRVGVDPDFPTQSGAVGHLTHQVKRFPLIIALDENLGETGVHHSNALQAEHLLHPDDFPGFLPSKFRANCYSLGLADLAIEAEEKRPQTGYHQSFNPTPWRLGRRIRVLKKLDTQMQEIGPDGIVLGGVVYRRTGMQELPALRLEKQWTPKGVKYLGISVEMPAEPKEKLLPKTPPLDTAEGEKYLTEADLPFESTAPSGIVYP